MRAILVLALAGHGLRSPVAAWSLYAGDDADGTATGGQDAPPYPTALAALRDGWRLVQYSLQPEPPPGAELRPGALPCECVLERYAP